MMIYYNWSAGKQEKSKVAMDTTTRLRGYQPEQVMLLSAGVRDCLQKIHKANFVLDIVGKLTSCRSIRRMVGRSVETRNFSLFHR